MTQEAAAKRLEVRQATWSGYESGRQTPRTEKALEIATLTEGEVPVEAWVKPAEEAGLDPEEGAPDSNAKSTGESKAAS